MSPKEHPVSHGGLVVPKKEDAYRPCHDEDDASSVGPAKDPLQVCQDEVTIKIPLFDTECGQGAGHRLRNRGPLNIPITASRYPRSCHYYEWQLIIETEGEKKGKVLDKTIKGYPFLAPNENARAWWTASGFPTAVRLCGSDGHDYGSLTIPIGKPDRLIWRLPSLPSGELSITVDAKEVAIKPPKKGGKNVDAPANTVPAGATSTTGTDSMTAAKPAPSPDTGDTSQSQSKS